MKYVLLHPVTFALASIAHALEIEGVTPQPIHDFRHLSVQERPTVLLLDPPGRDMLALEELRRFTHDGGTVVVLGAPAEQDVPDALPDDVVAAYVPHGASSRQLLIALRTAYREAVARSDAIYARREVATRSKELAELTRIGMALTTERDYNKLLELILTMALQVTGSDAGSLYIVETPKGGEKQLRFKLAQNVSCPAIPFVELTIPLNVSSIAGNVALTGRPLVIDDVYDLPPNVEYTFNYSIDERYGYRSRSMLTIPMMDHQEEVIGVLQLINRKRNPESKLVTPEDFAREVVPYSRHNVELVSALAGQAAVSIENSQLYEDIERLFEGFVTASVTAIEQRDPTTFGHSGRVASMTVALAETVDRDTAAYRNVHFSREKIRQIRYAGLLHDFGKVGVREQVLVKAKKLYPHDYALVKQRHAFIRRTAERDFFRQRMQYLEQHGQPGYKGYVRDLKEKLKEQLAELDAFIDLVTESNEPTVLPEGNFEHLLRYADRYYHDIEGKRQPYLTADEVRFLSIRKGSLDESERLQIEQHVTHTYQFLSKIPWTKELQKIPDIAYGHHEKLDGSGYPRHVKGHQMIAIETRMMTIADIFDALTASDRPYKRAVPVPRALDILAEETKAGMLDPQLFKLFVEAKVFDRSSETGNPRR